MADYTVKKSVGICDIFLRVALFIFLVKFFILDCGVYFEVPIILGRPFLVTRRVFVDMVTWQMKFWLNNK